MSTRKPYVEACDFVRSVTLISMVAVHATWYMANGGKWVGASVILAILHYTRESFMALTGFVLTYSLYDQSIHWGHTLWRRYRLVLLPYLFWSAAYMVMFRHFPDVSAFIIKYLKNLLHGGAWFHLYYLLVTMQFYLVLPLFLRLMRWGRHYPWRVIGGAFLFQFILMAYDQYGIGPHPHGLNLYTGEEVWTYTAYFVMGGVGALHWTRLRAWLASHRGAIALMSGAAALVMLAQFFVETYRAHNMARADSVVQPAMIPWASAVIVLLAAIGTRYEARRPSQSSRWPIIKPIADLSFGIYLVHPMLLQWWTDLLASYGFYHPSYLLDATTVLLLVTTSFLAAWGISRTPISPWIIGRSAIPPGFGRGLTRSSSVWKGVTTRLRRKHRLR